MDYFLDLCCLKKNPWEVLVFILLAIILLNCERKVSPVQSGQTDTGQQNSEEKLPEIQHFIQNPSDRFLVDTKTLVAGHPFKGKRAYSPHPGAHVHWDNMQNTWPKGGSSPNHYPSIYAVADGYIYRIDSVFHLQGHDRYGIDLAFAENDSSIFLFCYSIEPMVHEPSLGFYRQFIRVELGQWVHKGDTIAYMYLPKSADIGCHIHFHIQKTYQNTFLAPAIFTSHVVDSFYGKWGCFAYDNQTPIPPCMGYMLEAEENPFGTGPVDVLK